MGSSMAELERYPEGDVEDFLSGYKISKPFVPHVLDEELATELGRPKVDIAFEGDPATASVEEPVIVYLPHDIPVKQVARILAAHDTSEPVDPLADIKEKLRRDEGLEGPEIGAVLKFLLGI
jgi:hypothetical protein